MAVKRTKSKTKRGKKSPTRKSPTRKSPTRKSPTRKSPTRKSPTRKSPKFRWRTDIRRTTYTTVRLNFSNLTSEVFLETPSNQYEILAQVRFKTIRGQTRIGGRIIRRRQTIRISKHMEKTAQVFVKINSMLIPMEKISSGRWRLFTEISSCAADLQYGFVVRYINRSAITGISSEIEAHFPDDESYTLHISPEGPDISGIPPSELSFYGSYPDCYPAVEEIRLQVNHPGESWTINDVEIEPIVTFGQIGSFSATVSDPLPRTLNCGESLLITISFTSTTQSSARLIIRTSRGTYTSMMQGKIFL